MLEKQFNAKLFVSVGSWKKQWTDIFRMALDFKEISIKIKWNRVPRVYIYSTWLRTMIKKLIKKKEKTDLRKKHECSAQSTESETFQSQPKLVHNWWLKNTVGKWIDLAGKPFSICLHHPWNANYVGAWWINWLCEKT